MVDSKDNPAPDLSGLRWRAEEQLKTEVIPSEQPSVDEAARLIHELRVHQIELEMQNEELRQAQARLEESRYKYADLYDFAPVGYLTLDQWGRILEANLTSCALLGRERSRLLGWQFSLLLLRSDRLRFQKLLTNLLKLPERQEEFLLPDGEGNLRPMLLNILYQQGPAGLETIRVTLTDITELKQAQEVLKETEERLRRLNATLEEQVKERTAELEQSNRELESFSYSVSHDLKTPLRAIQGFSRIALEEHAAGLDQEGHRLLQVVVDNTRLMGRLIDDLLNLARLVRQPLNLFSLNLTDMARSVFARLKSQEPERNLELIVHAAPPASGDYHLLQLVVANLLENAIKFTRIRKPGTIEVGGRSEGRENIYYVKDNGIGFDENYAHKLFLVFQRLHSGKEYEGTGVGLATVQRIIQRHGGRVWAESKPGEGATFFFSLPPPRKTKRGIRKPRSNKK